MTESATVGRPATWPAINWRAYAQLVRLPNVFTALADIGVGAFAANGVSPAADWLAYAALGVASACLYSAGMVWNDYFDLEQDRRERPFRPLPSGRVSSAAARWWGIGLLAVGWLAAAGAAWRTGRAMPAELTGLLAVAILLYDRWLKRTWAGPLGMGACRLLNVLLGFSVLAGGVARGAVPALAVGVYIMGVTWFARTEAKQSSRTSLNAAAAVMACALLLALPLPLAVPAGTSSPLFPYMLVALGLYVGVPVGNAIALPVPSRVQKAVKRAIFGLVVLDAALASALAGTTGLLLLLLLLPAAYLGRWIYST